ncbi:MAG: ABC transporter substrate-binding protein [Prolixibacteraceae bacterium]|jgi:NitT/TauT family transport system substrate-binding protein|nr:ABC transporter substrate-binding protein [Prolixibacteraceae bacterium]
MFLTTQAQFSKIVFAPQWLPQAQFAGFYAAQEKGFYKDAGIDVEIIHPSTSIQATSLLLSGKADLISLFLTTALSVRNQGTDLVNVGQISQHSAIMIVTKKTGGIENVGQLNGKKVGIWKSGFDELPKALIAEKKLKVEWVPILSSVNLFMMGGIDAMTVMSYNEYDQIINSGLNEEELNVFPLADYGFDVPEDGLYCLRSTYLSKKATLNKFLSATLKGWDFAAANKEYALEVVIGRMQLAHVAANKVHQEWMLNKVLDLIAPGDKKCKRGELLESDFDKANRIINKGESKKMVCLFPEFYPDPTK